MRIHIKSTDPDANRIQVVNMLPSASPRGGVPVRVFGVAA